MEQEFTYQGEIRKAVLENGNSDYEKSESYKAKVGDKELHLNIARISANCFSISFDGQSKTVHVAQSDDSIYVHIDGRIIRLGKIRDDAQKFSAAGLEFGAKDEIKTPMPGKVVKLLVSEGESVESGQALVIVESMKMENEIKSPTKGKVKSVNFAAGDLVSPDQAIINLEPEED
jgi:biotin carboxyl carrier protein